MRRLVLTLGIALLLLSRSHVGAAEQALHPFSDDLAVFTDYLESLRVQVGIPGLAAAIVGPNRLLWERAFGQQDQEQGIPTSTDTPFHFDGLTQLFTASVVLHCAEQGELPLDDPIATLMPGAPEPDATVRQLLTHTSGPSSNLVFAYRPERIEPLWPLIEKCSNASFRQELTDLFDRLAMLDSVPGPDAVAPRGDEPPSPATAERYTRVLQRLAVPYAVDARRRARSSEYSATTLTTASGLISTVRDFAEFDVALRNGLIVRPDTLDSAWQPALDGVGRNLPHGMGWFVQVYNQETIVWQFGVEENAASSLVITLPRRDVTLILLANSSGLVKSFPLAAGDVTVSPFAQLFLKLFVR